MKAICGDWLKTTSAITIGIVLTIALDSGSLGVQLGGEEMNIVILSMDKDLRSKLLSDRFAIGSDASAAWGNGASAHGDPNAKILLYGHTKGAFAGFDLDGATLKPDDSGNKANSALTRADVRRKHRASVQPLFDSTPRGARDWEARDASELNPIEALQGINLRFGGRSSAANDYPV